MKALETAGVAMIGFGITAAIINLGLIALCVLWGIGHLVALLGALG